jgi:hypothetical protein
MNVPHAKEYGLDAGEFASVFKLEKTALDKLFGVFKSDQKD